LYRLEYLNENIFSCLKAGCIAFSMQVVVSSFFLNPGKNLAQIRLIVFEKKRKKRTFNSEKMKSPSRRLGYSNN